MNPSTSTLLARTSFACILALSALHAQPSAPATRLPDTSGAALTASDLIGMKIENSERQNIGKVEGLAFNLPARRVAPVVLSTGGMFPLASRHVAVPPGRVHFAAQNDPLHFDVTRGQLKSAPEFELAGWKRSYAGDRPHESDRHFGREPSSRSAGSRKDEVATGGCGGRWPHRRPDRPRNPGNRGQAQ